MESTVAYGMLALSGIVMVTLLLIDAPYGRHYRAGWGPTVRASLGWIVMEAPAVVVVLLIVTTTDGVTVLALGLMVLWQTHYFYRAFIYPFTLKRANVMPVAVVFMGFAFNCVNGYLIGSSLTTMAALPSAVVFVPGLMLFFAGMALTRHADAMLRRLRSSKPGYSRPQGVAFRLVSCPNYLGEIVQWAGWLLMTVNLASLVFLCWTIANLVPRALAHHRWYQQEFPDYPAERKALVPFLL